MKFFFTSILFLFSTFMFGQSKMMNGVISPNGDTTYWYKIQHPFFKKISLPQLDTTSNEVYYRLWINTQVIDVWQNPNGSFSGMLASWVDENTPDREKPTNRTFVKKDSFDTNTTDLIRQLFISSNILKLPTQDSIKDWQQGLDGIEYIIEYATKNYYSLKTYWSPCVQDSSLKEAKQVQTFVDSILTLANARVRWKTFSDLIPFQSYYTNGGAGAVVRILTEAERKKYFKERKNYRKQKRKEQNKL